MSYGQPFGRYILEQRIASGGMAEVFLASLNGIHGFSKKLCIKCILPSLGDDSEFIEMFVNEARILASLLHPNIVQVYEFGIEQDIYYLVMEYVDGADLSKIEMARKARTQEPWPQGFLVYIARSVLQALNYAYHCVLDGKQLELIHRDVSPQNILVAREGYIKLADFGIAKSHQVFANKTKTGVIKGKFSYMSPEQLTGKTLDQRSDLYSLGIILHELIARRRFYQDRTTPEIILQAMNMRKPPSLNIGESCSKEFSQFIETLLEHDSANRFSTAEEALHQLERIDRKDDHQIFAKNIIKDLFEKENGTILIPTRTISKTPSPPSGEIIYPASNTAATVTFPRRKESKGHIEKPDTMKEINRKSTEHAKITVNHHNRHGLMILGIVVVFLAMAITGLYVFNKNNNNEIYQNDISNHRNDEKKNKTLAYHRENMASQRNDDEKMTQNKEANLGKEMKNELPASRDAIDEKNKQGQMHPIKKKKKDNATTPGEGIVGIFSKPWAEVWIDGKKIGITPILQHTIKEGRHHLELINEPGGMKRKLLFKIKKNETLKIYEDLSKDDDNHG